MRFLALLLAVSALALACDGSKTARSRPNILLVTLDTMRADYLEPYGAPKGASPQINAIAARGVVFERMLAASSRTAPSHASLFTSLWVRDHSIGYHNGGTRLSNEPTLAGLLANAGYETAAFVSNVMLKRRIGLDANFDHYDDALPDREMNRPQFERTADKTTGRARAWLDLPHERPLFLWVHYNDPHGPYTPPPMYVEVLSGEPDAQLPVLSVQRGIGGIPKYQVFGSEREPRQYRARYAAEVRYLDASIGRLVGAFEQSASDASAIVVITADHGESMGEEGVYFSHGFGTAPNLAHIPFLLLAEGLPASRHATPVHHVDVMPTLLEFAGLPIPPEAVGRALGPVLRGEAALSPDRTLYVDVGEEVSVYRGETFVRARFGDDLGAIEKGSRQAYHWTAPSSWEPVAPEPKLAELAEAYERDRAPLLYADELDAEDAERLRALGYLEADQ